MKDDEGWSRGLNMGRIPAPIKAFDAVLVFAFFTVVLTAATCYFIALYQGASADLAALCADIRKLPAASAIDASRCP